MRLTSSQPISFPSGSPRALPRKISVPNLGNMAHNPLPVTCMMSMNESNPVNYDVPSLVEEIAHQAGRMSNTCNHNKSSALHLFGRCRLLSRRLEDESRTTAFTNLCQCPYLWLVGNGGMGYNYNYYYYHSSIPY